MVSSDPSRRLGGRSSQIIGAFALPLAAALALAGCSGGVQGTSSGGSGDSSAAASVVAKLEKAVSYTTPGPSFAAGDALRGKGISLIVSGESAAFVQDFISGVKDAAKILGASVDVQDSQYDPTKASELIDKAVAAHAAAIVTQSVDSTTVAASLQGAKAAGIPVIEATSRDAGAVPAEIAKLGVSAIASFCYSCAGAQMADYAVASTKGDVHALLYKVPGVVVSDAMVSGFQNELKKVSPNSTTTIVSAPAADWQSNLATLTTSNLQTNPNINWLVPVFDAMVSLIEPAVASSGLSGTSVVTYNASQPALKLLASRQLVKSDIGNSPYWLGWGTVDQIARIAAGQPPLDDEKIPARLFDSTNISTIDLTGSQQSWYGDFDLAKEYSTLWG